MRIGQKYLIIGAAALALVSCATNPVTGKKDFVLLSEQQEIALGQESDPAIVESFGLYEDQRLQEFIDQKGQEMARISHRPHLKYSFKILDSPVVNAFAVPGGYVYFTRGILAHFNNEAEFAGVLGHEIGHITARHSVKQYSKQLVAQGGLLVGMVLSSEFAAFSDVTQQAVGLIFLKFGRDAESQSDELGVEYSTAIGYDAAEMAHFFKTLSRMRGSEGSVPDFLSTHPNPDDRYNTVGRLAADAQAARPGETFVVNRDAYLQMVDGLVYGQDPRAGFIEGSVFYQPSKKFMAEVPGGWDATHSSGRVLMSAPEGDAVAMISPIEQKSMSSAIRSTVEDFALSNHMTKELIKNGMPVTQITGTRVVQQTPRYIEYSFLINIYEHPAGLIRALGVTYSELKSIHGATLQSATGSVKELRDQAILDVQPDRLRVVRIGRAGTLDEILASYASPKSIAEESALINGMELSDWVPEGTLIKLIAQGGKEKLIEP